jgi:DnaK suppressor protein
MAKMTKMTKTELNTFRKTLENRQTELESGSRNREALAIETSPDELDRIQHASNREEAIGNLERSSTRMREVQAALQRMDEGSFGICIGCEENISPKRLAAIPWATSCIACQEAADREQTSPEEIDTLLGMAA